MISGDSRPMCNREIYDIGTKILYFQCFVTTDMFLFCKPIIFSGNCRICRDLAFGSIKTRFKAILKNWIFRPRLIFSRTFAPGGRLSYEAYNVERYCMSVANRQSIFCNKIAVTRRRSSLFP